jgi:hypothetical protein
VSSAAENVESERRRTTEPMISSPDARATRLGFGMRTLLNRAQSVDCWATFKVLCRQRPTAVATSPGELSVGVLESCTVVNPSTESPMAEWMKSWEQAGQVAITPPLCARHEITCGCAALSKSFRRPTSRLGYFHHVRNIDRTLLLRLGAPHCDDWLCSCRNMYPGVAASCNRSYTKMVPPSPNTCIGRIKLANRTCSKGSASSFQECRIMRSCSVAALPAKQSLLDQSGQFIAVLRCPAIRIWSIPRTMWALTPCATAYATNKVTFS